MQVQLLLLAIGKELPGHGRRLAALATVLRQLRLARQPGAGHIQGQLPVALAIGAPGHPGPAILQAVHRAGGAAGGALPTIEQADSFRAAHALADALAQPFVQPRRLPPTGLNQKFANLLGLPLHLDPMPGLGGLHAQYPALDQLHAGLAQGLPQAAVERRAVQQVFDVLRMLLAVPRHPPLGRLQGLGQRLFQAGATQGFKDPHRNALQGWKAPPVADQGHRVAEATQPQGHRGPGRPRAEDQDGVHGTCRRSGPR